MEDLPIRAGSGRVRDLEGNVPLQVVLWLEQHPTAALATALAATSSNVRWLYRISDTTEVMLRGGRVELIDVGSGVRTGSARVHGVRSAADFDALPRALEPPPFTPPVAPYPATCGFVCDADGRVARLLPPEGPSSVGPGLLPRFTSYLADGIALESIVASLAVGHTGPSFPIAAFATRVRDLVSVLSLPTITGPARLHCWFEDERVIVWPQAASELVRSVVSALHARHACLGCSRHDPRDRISRGTYAYARSAQSKLESFLREDTPIEPADVATIAALLGRSAAELAATRLGVRFEEAIRVDPAALKRAT